MSSLNKVQLIGFLGTDPELSNGKIPNVSFSLATSESWFDKASQSKKENTTWHKIVIFNDYLKDFAMKSLKKGSKVYIDGQLSKSSFKNKNGDEQISWSVNLPSFKGDIILLSEKQAVSTVAIINEEKPRKYNSYGNKEFHDNDLPF